MSNRPWGTVRKFVTAGTVVAVLILAGALIYEVASSHTARRLTAERTSESAYAGIDIVLKSRCRQTALESLADCVRTVFEQSQEYLLGISGLMTQQDMADLAFWMLWVTMLSTLATTTGILVVWRTLAHTAASVEQAKRAAKAAEDAVAVSRVIGQAQVRAYMNVPEVELSIDGDDITVRFETYNSGSTLRETS